MAGAGVLITGLCRGYWVASFIITEAICVYKIKRRTEWKVETDSPPKHLLVKKGLLTVGVSPPVFPAQRGVGRYLNPSVITLHIKFCILNFSFKCSK